MDEAQIIAWIKDKANQGRLVGKFFEEQSPASGGVAIFMAGIPGSGKTEFVQRAKEVDPFSGCVVIEHDELVRHLPKYKPQAYYKYRNAGSVLLGQILKECFKQKYSFILDGTLSHRNGFRHVRTAHKKGYKIFVIYIVLAADAAWRYTQDRELEEKRP